MPRPKAPVPDKKHVNAVAKMKRAAQVGSKPGSRTKTKPRVKVGTKAAADLGIK